MSGRARVRLASVETQSAMTIVFTHVLLAIALLLAVNWISDHSGWWGYRHLSMVEAPSDAPAHNATFRILSPVVFLTVTAGLWYALRLDWIVRDYYLVAVYYFVLRVGLALALGRGLLVRWGRQFAIAGTSVALSFILYESVLRYRRSLLPDPTNLANELWIVIILFLYRTFNHVQWPQRTADGELRRRYIAERYRGYSRRYGALLEREVPEPATRALVYAVMIYESFNRPPLYQFIERHVLAHFRSNMSLGPMQVQAGTPSGAEASVREGARLISAYHAEATRAVAAEQRSGTYAEVGAYAPTSDGPVASPEQEYADMPPYLRSIVAERALARYNVRSDYPGAVRAIYATLVADHFPELVGSEVNDYERERG